jgi:exopolysaccharide production protein ExoZ
MRNLRQLVSLQVGRGLAAVMVVGHHTMSYIGREPRYWQRASIAQRWSGLQLGVEYFFVLSGVVMLMAHWGDIDKPQSLGSYLWKRFRRIYPIYWIVLTPVVLEYFLRPGLGAAYQRNGWVILSGYLLIHIRSTNVNLPVAWTLFHEMLFYALFALLLVKKRVGISVLAVWFVLSICACVMTLPWFLGEYLISPLHLLFGLGLMVGYLLRQGVSADLGCLRSSEARISVVLIGALTFFLAVFLAGLHEGVGNWVQLLAGCGSAAIILGGGRIEQTGGCQFPKWLRLLGDASYAIYLVHYPFLMFITPRVYAFSLKTSAPLIVPILAMVVSAVIAGCAVHVCIEKPLLVWLGGVRVGNSSVKHETLAKVH